MNYHEISPFEITADIVEMFGNDWMLICAGSEERHNAMTASWGQLGFLWNKPVASIYVRPQRYTYEFVEESDQFSLSFFQRGEQRAALELMGSKSGRDGDKIAEAGLSVEMLNGVPAFSGARLVLVCRKLYRQPLVEAGFTDARTCEVNYPERDFHVLYVGQVEKAYTAE